ncbi:hypothetical protein BH11PLA2_BH11PLA2_34990 [soil metagenome]
MDRQNIRLNMLRLEEREQPAALATLAAGTLTVTADAPGGRLDIFQDGGDIVVRSQGTEVGRFAAATVTNLNVNGGAGQDVVRVDNAITTPTTINGADATDKISAGGGPTTLNGGDAKDLVVGGTIANTFNASNGADANVKALVNDTITLGPLAQFLQESKIPPPLDTIGLPQAVMTTDEVNAILDRATAATATQDAIIVIVDRNGRILGVRVEDGVDPALLANVEKRIFAIDGAVALARTGAFFGNDEAPLTSRTVQYISQSTLVEREINSDPSITDPNSTVRGPGFVSAVGIKAHFPPNIPFTPQVDLFGIENTNRDTYYSAGADRIRGTADDELLNGRFNTDAAFTLAQLFPPDSYGVESGLTATVNGVPVSQPRGIATLPGGIPLYKFNPLTGRSEVVGGIGVFFPGKTGYATEENSALSTTYDPSKPDRSLEAEAIALIAGGGLLNTDNAVNPNGIFTFNMPVGGVALPASYGIPIIANLRIDLVGITLDVIGPGGAIAGPRTVRDQALAGGFGTAAAVVNGTNQVVDTTPILAIGDTADGTLRPGQPVADGWIVAPHDGVGVTAADVVQIVQQGLDQAVQVRAAIRLPQGTRAKFVFAVADRNGNIVGLYRMADATVFSIDVAVAKARNVNYYADAAKLQPQDQLNGIDPGTAFTNRTFRYLANPRFPFGIDGAPVGPWSQLNDPGTNATNGQNTGAPVAASAFQSVLGYDSFNPGTNFRDQTNTKNQNGIVFFPGSAAIYKNGALIGGFGVSGDGVDQDDVTTGGGSVGFGVPGNVLRADQVSYNGIRLTYQKFNRNPEG